MRRRFVQIPGGELLEVTPDYVPEPRADCHIIPDIAPFRSNDGVEIKGRAHWRDHLRANGLTEFGHSDMRAMETQHAKRKEAYRERLSKAAKHVAEAPNVVVNEARLDTHTRLAVRVANRLYGRPVPDRKTLIKIALEEGRRRR